MAILKADQLEQAAAILRDGGVVGMATETVYGLAADAMNLEAVARVFEIKGRPRFDPLIVHAATAETALELAEKIPGVAKKLGAAFWPGPMTLVLPKRPIVSDLVTGGLATVALRVPGHDLARRLIEASGTVLAAPSANRFGAVSPTCAADVIAELGDQVTVLDGGACECGVESTVIACLEDGEVRVLRLGSLTVESIEQVVKIQRVVSGVGGTPHQEMGGFGVESPGMLLKHYAPRTPLVCVESWDLVRETGRLGALVFGPVTPHREMRGFDGDRFAVVEQLSAAGDVVEAAANLFGAIRRLDDAGLDRIVACWVPEQGVGRAINDRLRRAGNPRS